jgi:hypothetical protein
MYVEVKTSMMVEKENESNSVGESIRWEKERERERERAGVLKRSGSEIYLYINPKEAMY